MQVSRNGLELIKDGEGLRLDAYLCPAKIPTIGYGNTMWPDGRKVELGQRITRLQADQMLQWAVNLKATAVLGFILPTQLNQNQFDALVSFAYNVGVGAFVRSTLAKKAKRNPNDPTIRAEFMRWNRAGGKVLNGLTLRRKKEADLYFTKPTS